jgi:hypothetical protein
MNHKKHHEFPATIEFNRIEFKELEVGFVLSIILAIGKSMDNLTTMLVQYHGIELN